MATTASNARYHRVGVPEESPLLRIEGFDEVLHSYPQPVAIAEAARCLQCELPFCVEACPIAQDCRGYIGLIAADKMDEAAKLVLEGNPLGTTLCKVCYHFCEDACVMAHKGSPIAIRHLKRAALEFGNSLIEYVPMAPRHQRVAVIGAGPAGLMAAWELGLRGYSVTVFEKEAIAGGQAIAIPRYRMPGDEIGEDIRRFNRLDVTYEMHRQAGVDFQPQDLLKEGYDAVYLAIGASKAGTANLPGEKLPGVIKALNFLLDAHVEKYAQLGRKIVVIGGGDVAIDSVRTAVRLANGGKVTMAYRRTRHEAPAGEEELREADPEGIEFRWLVSPVEILGSDHVEGVRFQKMELRPADASGRRAVEPIPDAFETIECDTVIIAVGQKADLQGLPKEMGLKIAAKGWPEGTKTGGMTDIEGVFAGGGRSVVHAMAAGTQNAEAIDAYLRQKVGEAPIPRPDPFGGPVAPPRLPPGYDKPVWTA